MLSLEANPPFQPFVMGKFVDRMLFLIKEANDSSFPLLFVLILPNWSPCPPIDCVKGSTHLLHSIILGKEEHMYSPGWQLNDGRDSSYRRDQVWNKSDTLIAFIGSESARIRYAFTPELDTEIRNSWIDD